MTMGKLLALLLLAAGAFVWLKRDSPGFGEWLRSASDWPVNLVLLATSGFEGEGRDPTKRP
jgi:hypothetical protein